MQGREREKKKRGGERERGRERKREGDGDGDEVNHNTYDFYFTCIKWFSLRHFLLILASSLFSLLIQ